MLSRSLIVAGALALCLLSGRARAEYTDSWLTYSNNTVVGYSEIVDYDDGTTLLSVDGSLFNEDEWEVVDENYDEEYYDAYVCNSNVAWETATYWEYANYTILEWGEFSDWPGGSLSISPAYPPQLITAINAQPVSCSPLSPPFYGARMDITYQLIDSNGLLWIHGASGLSVTETITGQTTTLQDGTVYTTGAAYNVPFATMSSSGTFDDNPYGFCYNAFPPQVTDPVQPSTTTATQQIFVDGWIVRVNTPTFTAVVGGGSVTNGVDAGCYSNVCSVP